MTLEEREKSIYTLKTTPDCTILIASLKCASLGLNLTCANRVIFMDVWWNPSIENQAIDRVHRLGQVKFYNFRLKML